MCTAHRVPLLAHRRPFEQGVERRAQRLAPVRETVLHLGRNLVVDRPLDDAIVLQLAQLLREHLLRDFRDCALQVGEAQYPATEQVKQDQQLPAAFEEFEGVFYTLRSGNRRQISTLTFW